MTTRSLIDFRVFLSFVVLVSCVQAEAQEDPIINPFLCVYLHSFIHAKGYMNLPKHLHSFRWILVKDGEVQQHEKREEDEDDMDYKVCHNYNNSDNYEIIHILTLCMG